MKRVTITIHGEEIECDRSWLHATAHSVAIEAEFDGDPDYLPAGTPALTSFHADDDRPPMRVEGEVIGQLRLSGRSRLQVAFPDTARKKIERAMNERVSLRVAPDPCNPVTALLSNGEEARVLDVSVDGCLLEFPKHETLALDSWNIRMELLIPGDARFIALTGVARKHARIGGSIQLAIQFDALEGEAGHAARQRLDRFVMERRLELLREEAEHRAA